MPQTSVLKTTKPQSLDGLRTDDLVIPTQFYSDVLVPPIDDNTLGNELTVDPFMDKEVIRGEYLISVGMEWYYSNAGKLNQIFERLDQLI